MNRIEEIIKKIKIWSITIVKGNNEEFEKIKYFNTYKKAMKYYEKYSVGNDMSNPNKLWYCLPDRDELKEKEMIAKQVAKEIFEDFEADDVVGKAISVNEKTGLVTMRMDSDFVIKLVNNYLKAKKKWLGE